MPYGKGRKYRPRRPSSLVARIKAENKASVAASKAERAARKLVFKPKDFEAHSNHIMGGNIQVTGYTKKDGSLVHSHTRKRRS